ncbi:hypothetical protein [Aureliella helgolandensis]|uniref:PEP-CTERM protein-sorting domain-containing protein n=1 Tax=Aureliella helgolandensis TaxID=2527968 RepID=A0A518G9W2_9BACT|nr:hypothetical protein [Aureliella helgolandensis]QDV25384.1 hypothetical protein Q31a_37100 [Aureliella helgolandensis]
MRRFLPPTLAALAVLTTVALTPSLANAGIIAKGDIVKFAKGLGGADGGGEFLLLKKNLAGDWSQVGDPTFCLEVDEFIDFNSQFVVGGISKQAVQGGVNTSSGDPLEGKTEFLFESYTNGTLSGFNGASDNQLANAVQSAIWSLEGERGASGLALDLIEHAKDQESFTSASVVVLNLFKTSILKNALNAFEAFDPNNDSTWDAVSAYHAQDQVFYAHAPEPVSAGIWGLGIATMMLPRFRRK